MLLRRALLVVVLMMIGIPALAQSPWYEGGTLQKGTVEEWNRATAENQLATSGDFIASLNGIADLATIKDPVTAAEMKKKSEDLRLCINLSIKVDSPPDQAIAEFVVRCTILKPKGP